MKVDSLNFNNFSLTKECSNYLMSDDNNKQNIGRSIIIKALENYSLIPDEYKEVWNSLVESAGFYPYISKEKLSLSSLSGEIRTNYHASDNLPNYLFHEKQKKVLDYIYAGTNMVVSAPTSFGKSLLIEEIVASNKFKNIVIIQPTLALLDETRKKLSKYTNKYKIIVRTSQQYSEENNIFLFTAERVLEYNDFPSIDFFVVDEFYKLSAKRDDERSDSLNNAVLRMIYHSNPQLYFVGPNIDRVSEKFLEKYNMIFFKTDYSLVLNESIDYAYTNITNKNISSKREKKALRELELFNLLYELKEEQTLIYCSSPNKAKKLAVSFRAYLQSLNYQISKENLPMIEWIEKNIHKEWSIVNNLKYHIGIHDGGIPKHITTTMIDYFNKGLLNWIFCTTTIIEGVNTTSKNVIFFDKTKGKNVKIDYFDYCNIKGRAGRMMVHYTGNIYNFNPVPAKENIEIDIPIVDQNPIVDEVLINLKRKDVKESNLKKYDSFQFESTELKKIIQKNGVSIEGQLNIIEYLNKNLHNKHSLLNWTGYPTYNQLSFVIDLAWRNLLKPTETKYPMTSKKLVKMTFDYGMTKSLRKLINDDVEYQSKKADISVDNSAIIDESISSIYNIKRHWFGYKVPKWLNVINSIQQYIYNKNGLHAGDYSYYSSEIENEFLPSNLNILNEYGIPDTAIKKLSKLIPSTLKEDYILNYIRDNKLYDHEQLMKYERSKILYVLD